MADEQKGSPSQAQVRYIVRDIDAAVDFYCRLLGFRELMHRMPAFAMLQLGALRLILNTPGGPSAGGREMPDGTPQTPGGWNRITLETADLAGLVSSLKAAGVHFRNDIVTGIGVKQTIAEDPSGNPVELFEPLREEAHLGRAGETPSPNPPTTH